MTNRTTPRRPALEGTYPAGHGAVYTIGRDAAIEAIRGIRHRTGVLAIDTEGHGLGLDALDLKCVQLGTADHAVILDPRDPAQHAEIRRTLAGAEELVLHNSPFDAPVLAHNGLMMPEDCRKITDTLVYARMAHPSDHGGNGLLACGARYLGMDGEDALIKTFKALGMSKQEGFKAFDIDRPVYVLGAATDIIVTARLLPVLRQAVLDTLTTNHPYGVYGIRGDDAVRLREREQRINRVMLKRSVIGLRTDLEFLEKYRATNAARTAELENTLVQHGIKPGNGNSLTAWLDAGGHLPDNYKRTKATNRPSATAADLATLDHPLAATFVEHKKVTKIESDYLQKVADSTDATGRIHPQTNILGADATGRMSMGNPPLHQFPGPARGIILADPGDSLVSVDWSQIEPVVAANVAGDTAVLAGYEDGTSDLYSTVADKAGVNRKTAKVIVLGLMYGEGLAKLAGDLGVTVEAADELKAAVFRAMPKVAGLLGKLRRVGGDHRKIFTLSGRIVPVPMGTYDGQTGPMRHKAVNYHIQGSAYDVLAESIIRIDEAGLSDAVYLAMHDELIVSESAYRDVERIMRTPPDRLCWIAGRTPVLRTDSLILGERWATA